jgi:hypothetical protein
MACDSAVRLEKLDGIWTVFVVENGETMQKTFVTKAFGKNFAAGQRLRLGLPPRPALEGGRHHRQQRHVEKVFMSSASLPSCPICHGSRFVCENRPRLAWPDECECGAGDPCPVCNVAEPPAMPDDFVRDEEADAALMKALENLPKN